MKLQDKVARRVQKKAEDLENENYHSEAGVFFDLAEQLRNGRFTVPTQPGIHEYLDGEGIINFIVQETGP